MAIDYVRIKQTFIRDEAETIYIKESSFPTCQ